MDNVDDRPTLFLDVDGVWGSFEMCMRAHFRFDSKCVRRICDVICRSGCRVVLSSMRRHYSGEVHLLEKVLTSGMSRPFEFAGKTPEAEDRGLEIREYVDQHLQVRGADGAERLVAPYAIADDDPRGMWRHVGRYVQVDTNTGISDQNADDLVRIMREGMILPRRASVL